MFSGMEKVSLTARLSGSSIMSEGPCAWHRRSFAPIKMLLAGTQLPLDLVFDDLPLLEEEELEPADDEPMDADPDVSWRALLVG